MLKCGRVRTPIRGGMTQLVEGELQQLRFATLSLSAGGQYSLHSEDRELAVVLICGDCDAVIEGEADCRLGPRSNPFDQPPYALFVGRSNRIGFRAREASLLGIGSAPAARRFANSYVTPEQVATGERGTDNWKRSVRMICWSDNTEGNMLLAGETCTPSGNWSTVPPHRHQYDIPDTEAPYEEVYFFQFSRPHGFGLTWQFDDSGEMDQAYSLRSGDALYMSGGYHPVACAPGSTLYHLSLMAGPQRISRASVHKDYEFLLEENQIQNQYRPEIQ